MELFERKLQAIQIADLYNQLGYTRYVERMSTCMSWAKFVQKRTGDYIRPRLTLNDRGEIGTVSEELEMRLVESTFCRVRLCPICQWRKAMRWQAIALKNYERLQSELGDRRWLFLTLTTKNCYLSELNDYIQRLNDSFLRWVRWKSFPASGWIKSLEVALSKKSPDLCHPHFHVLLMVDPDYFNDDNYWNHLDWSGGWQKVAKLDYNPIVDIRAIKEGKEKAIIPEVLKYGVKPQDLAEVNREQLRLLTRELHGVRAINKGGCLRKFFQEVGNDDIDLIGSKEDGSEMTGVELNYRWDSAVNGFQAKLTYLNDLKMFWTEAEGNNEIHLAEQAY